MKVYHRADFASELVSALEDPYRSRVEGECYRLTGLCRTGGRIRHGVAIEFAFPDLDPHLVPVASKHPFDYHSLQ